MIVGQEKPERRHAPRGGERVLSYVDQSRDSLVGAHGLEEISDGGKTW